MSRRILNIFIENLQIIKQVYTEGYLRRMMQQMSRQRRLSAHCIPLAPVRCCWRGICLLWDTSLSEGVQRERVIELLPAEDLS